MRLWPYDSFEIQTLMSIENIVQKLEMQVEPMKLFRRPQNKNTKTFQGEVSPKGFTITRIISYRNAFSPIIRGEFKLDQSEVLVAIRLCLQSYVIGFSCLWFGGIVLAILIILVGLLSAQMEFRLPMLLIPFGLFFSGWALVNGSFWLEAKKQKPMLIKIFESKEKSEPVAQADRKG